MSERLIVSPRQAMLLADAQVALQALSRSLQNMPVSGDEALLHLSDLSGLYSAFGLKSESDILRQLSARLAEDAGDGPAQLLLLMPDLQAVQMALEADDPSGLAKARASLTDSAAVLWSPKPVVAAQAQAPVATLTQGDAAHSQQTSTGMAPGSPPLSNSFETPLFSAGLMAVPFVQPDTQPMGLSSSPVLAVMPDLLDVRAQAWQVLQDVGQSLSASSPPDVTELLVKLGSASDALTRIGQIPLEQVYPDAALSSGLWVDFSVAKLLEELHVFSTRCHRITAQQRNQTLFVHWFGLSLSHTEADFLGQKLAQAMGRAEKTEQGLQLVLPVSLARMRLVSYRQDDQWHAVSHAQFMGWTRSVETGKPVMNLCAGFHACTQSVQEPGQAANMVVFPWPAAVPVGPQVAGLALNREGLVHILHQVKA